MIAGHNLLGRKFTPRLVFIVPVIVIVTFAALWRFTPLRDLASQENLQALMQAAWTRQWWTVLLVMAVYIIANLVMFPNSLLNIAVILGAGGFLGWTYAICGSLSAATVFFLAGRFWGAERLNTAKHPEIPKIRKFLAKGGIAAVVAVHVVPTAPYVVVNSIIGTFNIRYRDFVAGTFIGHLPGTLCLALFGKQVKSLFADPSPLNIAILLLIAGAAVVLLLVLRKRLKAQLGGESEPEPATAGSHS